MTLRPSSTRATAMLAASGVIDWLIIIGTGVGGYYLGNLTPNKRPFQLENPDISFPFTVNETVTSTNLVIATVLVPAVVIIVVSLVATPGLTVPPGTPSGLVWRRKLWELYTSLLSLAAGLAAQWFIVNGLKNVCGKPRPDMLSRCEPDLANLANYVVGGIANITSNGQLVSADICTSTDTSKLNDGFRSYPSGHSASSAAGLGHLAIYLAYKLGVVFPRAPPAVSGASHFRPSSSRSLAGDDEALSSSAFPSRVPVSSRMAASAAHGGRHEAYELVDRRRGNQQPGKDNGSDTFSAGVGAGGAGAGAGAGAAFASSPFSSPSSLRLAGAAPPLYLMVIVLAPFGGSLFIAASRWYNFRHHGFDILFGYLIGTITGLIAFRMYQLPMSRGAGWAWGPRASDKAFWAGVGSHSWSASQPQWTSSYRVADEEEGALYGDHGAAQSRSDNAYVGAGADIGVATDGTNAGTGVNLAASTAYYSQVERAEYQQQQPQQPQQPMAPSTRAAMNREGNPF